MVMRIGDEADFHVVEIVLNFEEAEIQLNAPHTPRERRQVMITRMAGKGLLSIPLEIRRKFEIKEGTRVHVDTDERGYRIIPTPITREYIQHLSGKYKGKGLLKALVAENKRAIA